MAKLQLPQSTTVQAIVSSYEADTDDGFRAHLGASIIGIACVLAIWLNFRWTTSVQHPGRLLRLFETGHREEDRMVANLRRVGITVLEVDPNSGHQWRVEALGGHFGGSLDGVALGVPEAPKTWHVCEFKTHNEKSFKDLQSKGVKESKPQHFSQMQIYMDLTGMSRALYLAVNKNNDELYDERIRFEPIEAERLLAKAKQVVEASHPPSRISEDESWYQCRLCSHHGLCHGGQMPEINCRTCLHVTPKLDGSWHCARWNKSVSTADQRQGCAHHLFIPDLVPAKQIDANVTGEWVDYRFPDGTLWRNGPACPVNR
jgi:hypothetical protein